MSGNVGPGGNFTLTIYTRSLGSPPLPTVPYVLLVDDEDDSIGPLSELVRYAGFQSVAAKCVADAVACCFHRRPSLLVTDLVMPGHDGRTLARRVKRRYPTVPILLVSGQDLDQPDWMVPPGLFTAIFSKPLDFERFIKAVERHMLKPFVRGPQPGRP